MPLRASLIAAALLTALAWFNWQVIATERHIAEGTPVLFELGTADPRSLIQGDYMVLSYRLPDALVAADLPQRGLLAVTRDADGVVVDARLYEANDLLAPGELLVAFHRCSWVVCVGPDSFFFQEGEAEIYAAARYAELRVAPNGEAILVGLRDENRAPLGRSRFP
ncbi:MAG: GDYXXLXY domain-containing protein [Chloroflexi bacterium OHK40]